MRVMQEKKDFTSDITVDAMFCWCSIFRVIQMSIRDLPAFLRFCMKPGHYCYLPKDRMGDVDVVLDVKDPIAKRATCMSGNKIATTGDAKHMPYSYKEVKDFEEKMHP